MHTTRPHAASFALAAFLAFAATSPHTAAQGTRKVPAAVAALLPPGVAVRSDSWAVMPTEFGKSFGGDLHAGFPGRPVSCDNTVGPELRVSLKGDTAWESPPMLDMAVQMHDERVANAGKSLAGRMANLRKSNSGVKSVAPAREQGVPGGKLFVLEYTENCARRPNGTNTVVLGYARKGATQLSVDLWLSAPAAEAAALVAGMLSRFQQLDTAALAR